MKKLIALLAVIGYVPFAHAAEGDWTHSGEFRLQYTNNESPLFGTPGTPERTQTFHQRSKLNTTVRAGEKMTFNLGLVHNADWGSNADQYPDNVQTTPPTTGVPPIPDTAGNGDTSNVLTVNEAYMTWQASDEATIKVGRITQTFGDGTVVSSNEWQPVQKAFDGGGMIYDLEAVRLGVFGVRGGNTEADANESFGSFYGVSADLKTLPAFLKMVNLHYIMVQRSNGTYEINNALLALEDEKATRMGVTVAGDAIGIDYRGTYAMYTGDIGADDIDASMMDFEVGYSMPAMMNFRVHAGYHMDSGDDEDVAGGGAGDGEQSRYQPFHYQEHENAGLMDVVGWGNLTYTRVGVALSPMEDLTIGAEYLMFEKTEQNDAVYGSNGITPAGFGLGGGAGTFGTDEEIGSELDVVVTKKYTNNFAIQARYGMFEPGDAFADATGFDDDTFTQWYLEGKMSF